MQYLGISKTKHFSSICLLDSNHSINESQLILTERLIRKKCSGAWPELPLMHIFDELEWNNLIIGENRDMIKPNKVEDILNTQFPFYDHLKKNNLFQFTQRGNNKLNYISHHDSHAYCALSVSPFEQSIIVVLDGAGELVGPNQFEECSVYKQSGPNLELLFSTFVEFDNLGRGFQTGSSYETVSKFIFNNPLQSGKVMGLASFGKRLDYDNISDFMKNLDWNSSFKGKSKKEWESYNHDHFKNVASTVQYFLEERYLNLITEIKKKNESIDNLILAGGCAMNCTNNSKLMAKKIFNNIYIPPFPGDDGISLGIATKLKLQKEARFWSPLKVEDQSLYLGAKKSSLKHGDIIKYFTLDKFQISNSNDIVELTVNLLTKGEIVAWFQGRSETGQRSLGNRSILCRPDIPNLKIYLNEHVKFRESFRPYGCSVIHEMAEKYFEVDKNFDSPFMSFAVSVKKKYQQKLKEVCHIDNTSRIQTIRASQNKRFYDLILRFGQRTNLFCLLNTSLNVMDEPIVETVSDAARFFHSSSLSHLVIGDYLITKIPKL